MRTDQLQAQQLSLINIQLQPHHSQYLSRKYQATIKYTSFWCLLLLLLMTSIIAKMQEITSKSGKLLLFIYNIHKQNKINDKEKGILKDLVVSSHKGIYEALARYEHDGTELTLESDLKQLLIAESKGESSIEASEMSEKRSQSNLRRSNISVSIPKRDIQKFPHVEDRI